MKRENIIIQTKVPPNKDPSEFRKALETSFQNLQVDYLDLFAFHGLNFEEQMEWIFEGEENCLKIIQEYVVAGKIKHVGFSTHGSTKLIMEAINKDCFDYVNLHYHYFGSYTASGGGHDGEGNLDALKLLEEKNMGIFIISPYDKGGRLYAPSKKLRSLTLPEFEPISFASHWLWAHHELSSAGLPMIHTFTVGAARPADLDQPAVAAYCRGSNDSTSSTILANLTETAKRLQQAKEDSLGKAWVSEWWIGLKKASENSHFVEHNQIIWLFNCLQAFGMYGFCRARYVSFENNGKKWKDDRSAEENIDEIGKNSWGFVPGIPLKDGEDYTDDFSQVPQKNLQQVLAAEEFVKKWLASTDTANGGDSSKVPDEWLPAYDMRTWPDFPDRPSRDLS